MTINKAMRSGVKVIFLLLVTCSLSSQQPFILSRQTYKGLKGILPSVELNSFGFNRVVYYHDQAVAVIDINQKKEMQNCDIIEVYESIEAMELLKNLSIISKPIEISFSQMTKLMMQCQELDSMQTLSTKEKNLLKGALAHAKLFSTHAVSLLSGIAPGTKWCGTGDVAENYHDLGVDTDTDRCCRTHDLCPVKIRSHHNRYNLTNHSLYSKSHCDCDNTFYHCLKSIDSYTARFIGTLYFNIVKAGCIEDLPEKLSTMLPSRRFSKTQLLF